MVPCKEVLLHRLRAVAPLSGLLCLALPACIELTAIEGDIQYWLEVGVTIPDTLVAEVEYPVTVTVNIATVEVSPNGPEDWYEYQGLESPDSAHVTVGFEGGTVEPPSGATNASGVFTTLVRPDPLDGVSEIRTDFLFSATAFGRDLSSAPPGSRGGELIAHQVVVLASDSIG